MCKTTFGDCVFVFDVYESGQILLFLWSFSLRSANIPARNTSSTSHIPGISGKSQARLPVPFLFVDLFLEVSRHIYKEFW